MRKILFELLAMLIVATLTVSAVGCIGTPPDNTIYVGNTAGTTGALTTIGAPFNFGIEAAFAAYNKADGYTGLNAEGKPFGAAQNVKLKHYDDGGIPDQSKTLTEKLIHDDQVFAIVGNFAAICVEANLDVIKEANVPMIYAAAGNDILHNDNAITLADRGIFPVQPLNKTEGRMLVLRAFAPVEAGGLAATKVGVLSDAANEASITMLRGINAELETMPEAQKTNVIVQEVSGTNYSGAVNALKNAKCDVIVITSTGENYLVALKELAKAEYACKVLTTYNNASTAAFNQGTALAEEYANVFKYVNLYSQAWLDLTSTTEFYKNTEHALYNIYYNTYLALYQTSFGMTEEVAKATLDTLGIPGFKNEYWTVAENLYDYALESGKDAAAAYTMSYDAYALAGYIAGDLFCQGLEALEESELALTRENYVDIMESKEYKIVTANNISFANGLRHGVDSFALTQITSLNGGAATAATVHTLTTLDAYRALIAG